MKKFVLLFFAIFLCACARQTTHPGGEQGTEGELVSRWQLYKNAGHVQEKPFRLQLSLRFGEEGNTRRVTALLWGNGGPELRLDVMAGVGSIVAKILEDGPQFLVYAPLERKAYFHQGATSPLLKVGVPIPFDLARLTSLLTGHYALAFGNDFSTAQMLSDGTAQYTLKGMPGGLLSLNSSGLPIAWREAGTDGWQMEILYDDAPRALPRRLNLIHASGKRAILLIKERENPPIPFTREQLRLNFPANTPLLPLAQYRATNS